MAPRVFVFFFKSVVQLVLIFAAETWVVSPCVGQVLGGGVPGPGGKNIDREAPEETDRRKMGVYLSGGGNRGGRIIGDVIIHSEKA